MAEGPASDRLAFAFCPPLKPDRAYSLRRKARQLPRSQPSHLFSTVRFASEESRNTGIFRVLRGELRRDFSAVKTAWRRKCDSNSHYRFESRNPRRLRSLQAVQHLTGELTSSDWPLDRSRTVHLFVHLLRRTAYDRVAESGHFVASCRRS
jgi:hypothetical protein